MASSVVGLLLLPSFGDEPRQLVGEPAAASDHGCHLCAGALGTSQPAGLAEIISALSAEAIELATTAARRLGAFVPVVERPLAEFQKQPTVLARVRILGGIDIYD